MRHAVQSWAERLAQKPEAKPSKSAEQIVDEMLLDHPEMNASTTINSLKAEGIELVKKEGLEAEEADTTGGAAQMLRAESMRFLSPISMRESSPEPTVGGVRSQPKNEVIGWTRFKAVLIQEGLGNFESAFFYTREALISAVPVFEGKKIYADHPGRAEEQDRPERSVRDVLGHFENIHFVETDEGRGELHGDVVILPDEPFLWARSLMRHAYEYAQKYPDKSFVGLSINAMGDALDTPIQKVVESTSEAVRLKLLKAQELGIESVRVCSKITEAISCDLVTEAGAGGKVTQLIEGESMGKKKAQESEQKDPSQLAAEAKEMDAKKEMDGEHSDAAQDLELILSVLDKMGLTDEGEREEAKKLAMEAYECMKAEGMGEGAIHGVEGVLRMAKREMAKKAEAAKAEEAAEEIKHEEKPEEEGVKESTRISDLEKENLELKAKVQAFESEKEKAELESFIDTKLAESKLPRASTKAFREAAGEIRSREDFESKFKIWTDAQKLAGVRESVRLTFTEKSVAAEAGSAEGSGKLDFSKLA